MPSEEPCGHGHEGDDIDTEPTGEEFPHDRGQQSDDNGEVPAAQSQPASTAFPASEDSKPKPSPAKAATSRARVMLRCVGICRPRPSCRKNPPSRTEAPALCARSKTGATCQGSSTASLGPA